MKCCVCESILYLMTDYSHRNANNIVVLTRDTNDKCLPTGESQNFTVLDSGCSMTGRVLMDCFLQSLSSDDTKLVLHSPSYKLFRFVGGETKRSPEQITFPCTLAGKKIKIKTNVIDSDISLLLGKSTMKLDGIN